MKRRWPPERALGPRAFEEDVGHFWGPLETRPYMRARAALADSLWELGEREAAIALLKDMLRLNPNDNQGLRYVLSGWLLAVGDHAAVAHLLEAYDEAMIAHWAYAKTLLAFRLSGPSPEAAAALAAAWRANPHVLGLLVGTARIPKRIPDHYAVGSREEAVLYVLANRENWASSAGALSWLREAVQDLSPRPEVRR